MRLGIDLMSVDELDRLTRRAWFIRYAFADAELAHADRLSGERRREFLAGRFAAKEAVLKVLGTGLFEGWHRATSPYCPAPAAPRRSTCAGRRPPPPSGSASPR
ncbi:4'-phosphopantetheinyl transferase superfamily protein [Plantactinospora veratri]